MGSWAKGATPGNLLDMEILGLQPGTTDGEILEGGVAICILTSLPGDGEAC